MPDLNAFVPKRKRGDERKMGLSDTITLLIEQMLKDAGGSVELQRNDLAGKIGCVPSQINYVITSRFTPERGYIIESRRGGGGYIRIIKKQMTQSEYLMHVFHGVGKEIDVNAASAFAKSLRDNGCITDRELKIIEIASSYVRSDSERADMLQQFILSVMK